MKKYLVRICSVAVAAAMAMGLCCTAAFAAIPNTGITSTFTLAAPEEGNMTTSWNYLGNGSVAPVELKDEIFNKAYRFMYYPGGNPSWTNVYMKFDLDMPARNSNDGIYLSFYYKAASEFVGTDGKTYTSDASITMNHIRDAKERLLNLQTQGLGDFAFIADDKWHKIETYMSADGRFTDNALYIYNANKATMDVMIADIRVGVLNIDDSVAFNNDQCYTEMGWFLKELNTPSALKVNGESLDLTDGSKEFTVKTADFSAPSIEMTGSDYIINKVAEDMYEVTSVAYAYNKSETDAETVTYRQRGYDNGSGVWIYNSGSISNIETANSTLKGETYTIYLEYDEGFYVDGVKVDSEAVPAGKVYSYKKSFVRPEGNTIYACIAAYDKETNQLIDVSMQDYSFPANEYVVHTSIDMNNDNSDDTLYFKVFMLDSLENIKPLMESKSTASISVE